MPGFARNGMARKRYVRAVCCGTDLLDQAPRYERLVTKEHDNPLPGRNAGIGNRQRVCHAAVRMVVECQFYVGTPGKVRGHFGACYHERLPPERGIDDVVDQGAPT